MGIDFRELIKASRVSRHNNEVSQTKNNFPDIFEASIEDVPQCLRAELLGRQERQFVTVTSTKSSYTYATITSTVATTQTLYFSSTSVVANAKTTIYCFPSH